LGLMMFVTNIMSPQILPRPSHVVDKSATILTVEGTRLALRQQEEIWAATETVLGIGLDKKCLGVCFVNFKTRRVYKLATFHTAHDTR
jgi:hypothetical protein